MSNFKADVPLINLPLVGADGKVNETWFMFFIQLFRRTGGTMGSSPGDLSLNDIDLDADSLDADLSGLQAMFAESEIALQTKVDEAAPQKLISVVNDINTALQISADDVADKAHRVDLVAQNTEIALILEEAQDILAKLRRALQDSLVDQLTSIDPIRSMAYQDARQVKITGGSIDGTAIGGTTNAAGSFTAISATNQITSTLATGTAPFSIASTTVVPNLNVSQLLGSTWAIPGAIGSTTPNTGSFTSIAFNAGVIKSNSTVIASALATNYSLPGTEALSGLIRFRDRTLGGAACFLVDPNGGVQTLGTNQITGLSVSYNSGLGYVLQVNLSSGATPRTLEWSIIGGT
jgi:hypothetical protein